MHRNAVLEPLEDRLMLTVTAEEQLFVYLVNRARANPAAYQVEANIPPSQANLSIYAPMPPLALNDQLFASAQAHADDLALGYYDFMDGHNSPLLGQPNKIVRDAGYPLPAEFPNNGNHVESLGAGLRTPPDLLREFILDTHHPDLGHRLHMLGANDLHAKAREIGVGYAFNASALYRDYWAVHVTHSNPADRFLTGVVFIDANHNGRYDLNEGLGGVTVTANGFQTTTNAHGGWAIKVPDGQYTVTANGGGFHETSTLHTTVSGKSVAVDFASTLPGGWINFQRVGAQPPTIAATSQTIVEGHEGFTEMTFTVTLSGPSPEAWDVAYSTADGTAKAGSDYVAASGVLRFMPGETAKTITISVIGDTLIENDEIFYLGLTGPINSLTVTGSIHNDDFPGPGIAIGHSSIVEGDDGVSFMTFHLSLAAITDKLVTVDYSTVDGTATMGEDYVYQAGTVQFAPGQASATISVAILGDKIHEPNETFFINLSNPVNSILINSQAIGIIVNDDPALLPAAVVAVGAKKRTVLVNGQAKAVNFGTVAPGAKAPVQKFWVFNKGNAPMTLGRIRLPKGFALASTAPKTVPARGVATFLVSLSTKSAARYAGQITFGTTDPNHRTFKIRVAGAVGASSAKAAKATAKSVAASPLPTVRPAAQVSPFSTTAVRNAAIAELLN